MHNSCTGGLQTNQQQTVYKLDNITALPYLQVQPINQI